MDLTERRLWSLAAALWGFAEASVFFIVPDVLLTAGVLLFGLRFGLRLCVVAAGGAVLGGAAMYLWGASNADAARDFVDAIPLIGDDLLTRVEGEIAGPWPFNLTLGAVTGAPYKIYAVEAGAAGLGGAAFLLVSFAARLLRFALAVAVTAGLLALARRLGVASKFHWIGHGVFWGTLYVAYSASRLPLS